MAREEGDIRCREVMVVFQSVQSCVTNRIGREVVVEGLDVSENLGVTGTMREKEFFELWIVLMKNPLSRIG